ncbi:SDR family NAD(P)-dependent oxidoreductase [Nocardia sp. NPDC056952]|uniref:SDR family NAD(P)-dependent oxidoreductase n=1 Tax=Nocardia sp. NPDC056952 TaxID=3345979 RepID=UPI0036439FDA
MARTWTESDIPSQCGRRVVITGANSGLGFETARALAVRGASVVLAVRDVGKGEHAAERIAAIAPAAEVGVVWLDLASLYSVHEAAAELHAKYDRIDLLVNNAGLMYPPRSTTRDGFEMQFGTNHLGHFALTGLVLELLLRAPNPRVVTVSSNAHRFGSEIRFHDLHWEQSYDRIRAYGQSKLANLMFTYELQRRLSSHGSTMLAVAAHPGASDTALIRNSPAMVRRLAPFVAPVVAQSAAMGALPTLRAATDPAVLGGQFYGPGGVGQVRGYPRIVSSNRRSQDTQVQHRLWRTSERLTGVSYPF